MAIISTRGIDLSGAGGGGGAASVSVLTSVTDAIFEINPVAETALDIVETIIDDEGGGFTKTADHSFKVNFDGFVKLEVNVFAEADPADVTNDLRMTPRGRWFRNSVQVGPDYSLGYYRNLAAGQDDKHPPTGGVATGVFSCSIDDEFDFRVQQTEQAGSVLCPLGQGALFASRVGGEKGQTGATGSKAADIPMFGGFDTLSDPIDLEVRTYGFPLVIARSHLIEGEVATLKVAATGADLIFDVEKNGSSIYLTLPQFADGSTTLTPGILLTPTPTLAPDDEVELVVDQIGSTLPGQGLSMTLKTQEV